MVINVPDASVIAVMNTRHDARPGTHPPGLPVALTGRWERYHMLGIG
jgi:hypothetical protein